MTRHSLGWRSGPALDGVWVVLASCLDCDIFANLIGIIIKGGIGLALVGVVEQRVL